MTTPWNMRLGNINLTAGVPASAEKPSEEMPFRIALLGNFSGRADAARPLSEVRPILIDRDNFEEVLARLDPQVQLPLTSSEVPPVTIHFRELDDFHPDRLFGSLEVFAALRDLRKRLSNSSTFPAAAAEVRGWAGKSSPTAKPTESSAPLPADSAGLLEQILGGPTGLQPSPSRVDTREWDAFLRKAVAPYLVPGADPDQEALLAQVDEATSAQMRGVLHHPDFQALEAAWRAVHLLVRRLDTDEGLKLYLLDVTKEDLAADLKGAKDLHASDAYKVFVERAAGTRGGQPWALLIGDYTFGPTLDDMLLLAAMGLIAQSAGAPFLAAADSRLFGCSSVAATPDPDDWRFTPDLQAHEVWQALRATPQAPSLGLTAPRFLLRLPYGADSSEQFALVELALDARHEDYLWGNPAFACALLLGQAFNRSGWDLQPSQALEVDNLPAHVYESDGESQLKPCAEAVLSDRAVGRILDAGIMALVTVQGTDRARLARFQSVAEPPTQLAGRWR